METKSELIKSYIDYLQTPISRLETGAEKYELRKKLFRREDLIPMWVADMDLPIAPHIVEALQNRLKHPILGYTMATDRTYQAVIDWHAKKGLLCSTKQIEFTHNVANGFYLAVQAYTKSGDRILVMPPVYPPFFRASTMGGRKCVQSPLVLSNGRFNIDFENLELQIISYKVKLLLLCNPQNPTGRMWTSAELEKIAELCLKHQVTIVSDEIHSSLINIDQPFTSMASLSEEIANITITLDSPGKTFNLGGLQIGYAIIQNGELLKLYKQTKASVAIDGLNLLAIVALEAAYTHPNTLGWMCALKSVIKDNIEYLKVFLGEHYPQISVMVPEAGYLVWLDLTKLFTEHQAMKNWLVNDVKIGLNDGMSFSGNTVIGECCVRMNIAVPRATLEQACKQFELAKPALLEINKQ